MKIKKRIFIFLFIIFSLIFFQLIFFIGAGPAQASNTLWDMQGGTQELGAKFGQGGDPPAVQTVAANIVKVFLTLLGIIFLILIIYAGYQWMTAGGNENKIEEAKTRIRNSIIGILIIIAAYIIVSFVINKLAIPMGQSANGTDSGCHSRCSQEFADCISRGADQDFCESQQAACQLNC